MNSTIHHLVSTGTTGGFECRTSTDCLCYLHFLPTARATACFIYLTTPMSQVLLIWGACSCKQSERNTSRKINYEQQLLDILKEKSEHIDED